METSETDIEVGLLGSVFAASLDESGDEYGRHLVNKFAASGVNEKSVIRLRLFDKDNKTVCQTYKFYNVHIKEVTETSLSYSGGDASKFTVNAVCSYWTLEESKNGALTDLH